MTGLTQMSSRLYEMMNIYIGNEHVIQRRRREMHKRFKLYKILGTIYQVIPSGSSAEGLDMPGSDVDIMITVDVLRVHMDFYPDMFSSDRLVILTANTNDDQSLPGFVKIHLFAKLGGKYSYIGIFGSSDFLMGYISSQMPNFNTSNFFRHGPCMTLKYKRDIDIACCLFSHEWPESATEWITRKRHYSWPPPSLIQDVVNEGCLFVPIWVCTENDETWRISFSKAEKMLIFSFNHVQMLTYGLLKLFLNDVIKKNPSIDGLLCSYFMKTSLFWCIENNPLVMWKPTHQIPCFFLCLKYLIDCVDKIDFPNYFIKNNNMFRRKITGEARTRLLDVMAVFMEEGICCLFRSETIQQLFGQLSGKYKVRSLTQTDIDTKSFTYIYGKSISLLQIYSNSKMPCQFKQLLTPPIIRKMLLFSAKSWHDDSLNSVAWKLTLLNICHLMNVSRFKGENYNKQIYSLRQLFLRLLISGATVDLCAGKLLLAAWLYRNEQYRQCLEVVDVAMENIRYALYYSGRSNIFLNSDVGYHQLIQDVHMTFDHKTRLYYLSDVMFPLMSEIVLPEVENIRDEFQKLDQSFLEFSSSIIFPPNLFALFLRSKCYYYLAKFKDMRSTLRGMKTTTPLLHLDPLYCLWHKSTYLTLMHLFLSSSARLHKLLLREIKEEFNNDMHSLIRTLRCMEGFGNIFQCDANLEKNVLLTLRTINIMLTCKRLLL